MNTEKEVSTNTDSLIFGYWEDETETFVPLTDEEDVKEFLGRNDWKEKLIDAIEMTVQSISEEVSRDLTEIWERQEKIEKRIENIENSM